MPQSKVRKKYPPKKTVRRLEFNQIEGVIFSWESQVKQYPAEGKPNEIERFAGFVSADKPPVYCLLWRDDDGLIRGILNYYSVDYPPHERKDARNTFVDPGVDENGKAKWQRRGIATELHEYADELWGPMDLSKQKFTPAGEAFIRAYRRKH
jgi:hypothetical protein